MYVENVTYWLLKLDCLHHDEFYNGNSRSISVLSLHSIIILLLVIEDS